MKNPWKSMTLASPLGALGIGVLDRERALAYLSFLDRDEKVLI